MERYINVFEEVNCSCYYGNLFNKKNKYILSVGNRDDIM